MATFARTELEFAPLHLSVGNDKAAQPLVTPAATARPMLSEEQQDSGGDGLEEGLLPRLTRVLIRGNNRTKAALVGQSAVVRKSVGLGGWHLLVLANGEEVRLQRNALQIVALPVHGDTDFSDMDDEDTTVFPAGEAQQRPVKPRRPARPSLPESVDADEDYLERRISQRQAAVSRVNLQRLDAAALRRYRRFHKLPDVGPNSTKEQLLAAISRHFTQQAVDENRVIAMFIYSARQQALHGPSHEQ